MSENQNRKQSNFLGCTGFMRAAYEAGLSHDEVSVAMDQLESEGVDACIKFIMEQTDGKYPESDLPCWKLPTQHSKDIDAIPGRRVVYTMSGDLNIGPSRTMVSERVLFSVNQDGPFILTHFPLFFWQASRQEGGSGEWCETREWSYHWLDASSQRFMAAAEIKIFSRSDMLNPLPSAALFAPNSTIEISPVCDDLEQQSNGTLKVLLPGYRIVNM